MVDEEQAYSSDEEGKEVSEQVECEGDQCDCLTYDYLDGLMIALADLYGRDFAEGALTAAMDALIGKEQANE